MTYSELTTLAQDYLQNQETTFLADLPNMVKQAEKRIYGSVRTPDQRMSATGSAAAATFAAPASFTEPQGLYITVSGELVPLLLKQPSFIRTAYPSGVGQPAYYAVQSAASGSSTILLGPAPDASYPYTLDYFGNPASIVTAATTWLGDQFPDALLYGTLLEGYIYMKGEKDMRDTFQERFDRSMEMLRRSCENLQLRDEYRTSPLPQGAA